MNQQETNKILALMVEVYPKFNEGRNPQITSKLWSTLFQDEPYEWVEKAFMAYVATDVRGFPPSPGAIKEKIKQLIGAEEPTEMEAWNLVYKALSNGYYGAKEEFEKLPRYVQEIVGSPSQLREWSMMDISEVNTVVASNFQRSYRARAESRKINGLIPESLRINLPKNEEKKIGEAENVALPEPEYECCEMPQSFKEIAKKVLHMSLDD